VRTLSSIIFVSNSTKMETFRFKSYIDPYCKTKRIMIMGVAFFELLRRVAVSVGHRRGSLVIETARSRDLGTIAL
jgi:3-dehydroquinate dehydratase